MARPRKFAHKASQASRKHKVNTGGGNALDRVIAAIGNLHVTGMQAPLRQTVGIYAKVDPDTSTWRAVCAKLKAAGLADMSNPLTIKLTEAGLKHPAMTSVKMPAFSNSSYQQHLKDMMAGPAKSNEIFDYLASDGEARTDEELGEKINVDIKKST